MTRWSPPAIAESWIFATLSANSTVNAVSGIFPREATQGTPVPFITMTLKTAPNVQTTGQTIVWWNCHYNIDLVIGNNDIITPDPIFTKMEDLLHKGSGVTAGGLVIASTLEGEDIYSSMEAGVEYRHLVQMYEILVQQNLS